MESTVRELAATYQELAIAYGTLEAISLPSSRELIAQSLLSHTVGALNAEGGCFLTLDATGEPATTVATGLSDLETAALRAVLPSELERHPVCGEPFAFELGPHCVLALVTEGDEPGRGVIAICRAAGAPFSSREAKLLRASGRQAALAIRNRTLVDELRSLFVSTVLALVAAIEAKDPYTCGHSRRVAERALATAKSLGLPEAELENIHTAAIVHDVGKIAVDTAILRKPGQLDAEEWEVIRSHPERGAGIIACVPQLQHIAPVVRHHHERSDGAGYPRGLRTRQIPLASGVIAVCDSYDAVTSQRPYRGALSPRAARRELILCSGTQFEPSVVEAFVEALVA
jgi:HD-GYP domain-containing protein (c-di-GMP phosphodiesterase class II)